VAKPRTKFEVCSLSRSEDISWRVCHRQAGTCYDELTHQIWSA